MKKISDKLLKIIMLISMIFSSLQTPIYVLADELSSTSSDGSTPSLEKGDMKLGEDGEITKTGTVSTTSKSTDGKISVKKTVSKENNDGKYKVEFLIKGTSETSSSVKPSYTVFVLDASKSMDCSAGAHNGAACKDTSNGTPWANAKTAAINFSTNLVAKGSTNQIALVTFNSNGYQKRPFASSEFKDNNFGNTSQGTNYNAGLTSAYNYLNELGSDVKKNSTLNIIFISDGEPNGTSYETVLNNLKKMDVNIYTFAYNLSETSNKTAYDNLKAISTNREVTSVNSSNIDEILKTFVETVSSTTDAGKDGVLTDVIGNNFKIVDDNGNSLSEFGGVSYTSSNIETIGENEIKFTFYVQIDKDSPTGWYQTNNGFKLVYKDNNGNEQTIESDKDPYVYWVQNEYDYIVNYYKDKIADENLFKSDTRTAPKGTIINESNVLKDKYLSEAGVAYEYDSVSPESIEITNDGKTKVINVLYVKAYGKVIAKYVDEANEELAASVITKGRGDTKYETSAKDIYGYKLVNKYPKDYTGSYIANETIEVIYVYTKNAGEVTENDVTKTGPENITSVNGTFNYTLTYNGKIEDYKGKATLTLTDTLPYELDEGSKYDGCTYSNKVLTCVKEFDIDKEHQEVSAKFDLELKFKDVDSDKVVNKVDSLLTYGNNNKKDDDKTETEVFKGTVIAKYVDEANEELVDSVTTKGLGDTEYKTSEKDIYGYSLKEQPSNKNGTYVANKTIEVIYVYTKNAGSAETEVVKTQTNAILGANSTFKYTLTYNGEIENYKGKATLTLTDTLPYDVASIKIADTENCSFDESTRTLTCTKTYEINEQNKEINEAFTFEVVYKGLVSELDMDVKNEVNSKLTFGNTENTARGETTDKVLIGTVIAKYVDEANEELVESVKTTGLGDTKYETSAKDIYGYKLVNKYPKDYTGSYIANETIEVIYVYTKNAGEVTENDVTKKGPENITSVNGTFNYTLTYYGKIEDYVGKATLTLTDTLPYELENGSKYEGCTYSNKVLTCVKEFNIDKEHQEVSAKFDLELIFKDVNSDKVVNRVDSKLEYGNNNVTDDDETKTEVFKGTVITKYVDEANEELVDSVTSTGLGGTEYTTSAKDIYGYKLVNEHPENYTGTYIANETIEVIYVYSKNAGSTPKNEVVKKQTNAILGANSTFKYTLTYNGEIKDYKGSATLTLTDTLPYDVKSISYNTENCTFDDSTRTLTCTKTYEINEQNKEINEAFTFEVVYKGLVSELDMDVKNEVNSKLTFGNTENTASGETTDKVLIGTVIAKYVDEANEELAESVTTTGLGDTEYKTSEKDIYGYTLKGQPENKTGSYIANETIEVIYVYTKNAGEVTKNEVTKTGPENITSVNGTFNYTLTYNGKIEDYKGKATLTLTDTLPYELDEGSKYDGCTYSNKVLTCVKEFDIDKEHQEVSAKFDLELKFKDVDSDKVVNKVDSLLTYGNNNEKDDDKTETEVFKGTVVAIYKNRDGELLTENIVSTGLAGSEYETEELEFLGYTLTKLPENKNGKYVANQTTTVVYIYDKNVGTSEEHLEKTGLEVAASIDSAFEYKITYNLEVFDYVGDVNITLTDYLPFDIDLEKSDLGNVCKYNNGLLICEYKHTINTEDDSVINIEENLVLYYKDIDTDKVVNRIESLVVYGDEKKFDEDEFITEIPYGQIKVNYVTEDGKELSPSEISTGLIGADYKTNEKYFDDYYLKEVIGNEEGKITEDEQEITYVYSEIPLPPQTGITGNNMNYLGILVFAMIVLILKRRYI